MERDRETKRKKTRGRERKGEANLCFMIWLCSTAYTLKYMHAHIRTHRLLTVVTTCQGERQAANLKSLDVCRTGNNLLRSHTHKHTHTQSHITYTH